MRVTKKVFTLIISAVLMTTCLLPMKSAKAMQLPLVLPTFTKFVIYNERINQQLHVDANNQLAFWTDTKNPSNQWYFVSAPNHTYNIVNVRTGLQLHMDANNKVGLWNDLSNESNMWYVFGFESSTSEVVFMNGRTGLQMHCDANNKVVGWDDPYNQSNHWIIVYV